MTVRVEVPDPPMVKAMLAGLGEMAKSCSVMETIAECERAPLVPVTFIV